MLRRAKKNNPNALVAMCGCLAKNSPQIEGVDFVFDARKPDDFFAEINSRHCEIDSQALQIVRGKTRSFIKIQDGCDRFCSYCIVPHVRGEVSSRPMQEILSEAQSHIEAGALEIVLTGIQVAAYGQDIGGTSLAEIIKKTAALNGLRRLRLSSIDPWAVNENFLSAVASPVVCGHFHLSLQSGCDATLAKMNRRYSTAEYAKAADALRKIKPDAAITTDIIVGFPYESESHFEECLAFVLKMQFAKIHVFEFSAREGTPAANFPEQISQAKKIFRGKKMRELSNELQKNFLQKQIGKEFSVLFEKEEQKNIFIGNSENYCSVLTESKNALTNTIHKVQIAACEGKTLIGKLI
jgi:threonylcarbamoyladenosine tRNA methylthiotransferase MtaB